MHNLNATQNDARAAKVLEPKHLPREAFDSPMVLLDYVVQILDLPNLNGRLAPGIDRMKRGQIGTALVHGYGLGCAVLSDGFIEEAPGGSLVPPGSEQKVDGITRLVRCAIKIFPRAFDLDIGFIHAPALAHRALCLRNVFSNRGTSLITHRCTVEWSTPMARSAIISSRSRRLSE
jgi:hypothetical protein